MKWVYFVLAVKSLDAGAVASYAGWSPSGPRLSSSSCERQNCKTALGLLLLGLQAPFECADL